MAPKKTASKSASGKQKSVRDRVHELTLKAFRDGDLSLRDVPALTRELVKRTADGLDNAVPKSDRNVLRQVVNGLTDATAAAAKSTRSTISSVSHRSSEFVRKDMARTARDLRDLEDKFVSSLESAGKSVSGAARDEIRAIVRNARRAGTKIRPAAESALKAADGRVLELGKEGAKASVRVTRSAVSTALQGAGGLLQGLGDVIGTPRKSPAKKPNAAARKKRSRRTTTRKPTR